MELINEFIKNIVVCIMIMNIVDGLVISNEYSKYIKLFTGIIVIIVILHTSEDIYKKMGSINVFNFNKKSEVISDTTVMEDSKECISEAVEKINKKYTQNIKLELEKKHNIEVIKIKVRHNKESNEIENIDIVVKEPRMKEKIPIDKIYEKIGYYYDLRKEAIRIRVV